MTGVVLPFAGEPRSSRVVPGRIRQAEELLTEAATAFRVLGDDHSLMTTISNLALAAAMQADYDERARCSRNRWLATAKWKTSRESRTTWLRSAWPRRGRGTWRSDRTLPRSAGACGQDGYRSARPGAPWPWPRPLSTQGMLARRCYILVRACASSERPVTLKNWLASWTGWLASPHRARPNVPLASAAWQPRSERRWVPLGHWPSRHLTSERWRQSSESSASRGSPLLRRQVGFCRYSRPSPKRSPLRTNEPHQSRVAGDRDRAPITIAAALRSMGPGAAAIRSGTPSPRC